MNKRKYREKVLAHGSILLQIRKEELREAQVRNQIELVRLGIHPDAEKSKKEFRESIKEVIREVLKEAEV